jgi:hypothetical protein
MKLELITGDDGSSRSSRSGGSSSSSSSSEGENKMVPLVPYDAVDLNKVSMRQLVFIFLLSHYMFRPLRAIFR